MRGQLLGLACWSSSRQGGTRAGLGGTSWGHQASVGGEATRAGPPTKARHQSGGEKRALPQARPSLAARFPGGRTGVARCLRAHGALPAAGHENGTELQNETRATLPTIAPHPSNARQPPGVRGTGPDCSSCAAAETRRDLSPLSGTLRARRERKSSQSAAAALGQRRRDGIHVPAAAQAARLGWDFPGGHTPGRDDCLPRALLRLTLTETALGDSASCRVSNCCWKPGLLAPSTCAHCCASLAHTSGTSLCPAHFCVPAEGGNRFLLPFRVCGAICSRGPTPGAIRVPHVSAVSLGVLTGCRRTVLQGP